jgi:transposase
MEITTIGIDLAKNVFQVHGMNAHGKTVVRKRLSREKFLTFFANLPPCLVAMEACGSSNFWARRLKALGHDARLISPQFVKPYVKTNKNDFNDAEAICEAATRPQMRFVPLKSIEQQDIQAVHRVRQLLVQQRTALVNQARGLLREYGVFIPAGISQFRRAIAGVLEDAENELTDLTRALMADLYQRLLELDRQIADYERHIARLSREQPVCQRMEKVEGVGVLTATALMATVGDAKVFKNGRQMSAWLGLVPRQHSSGEHNRLFGISKRGDIYVRSLLIHGARSVLLRCKHKTDSKSRWLQRLIERRGFNRACVALANKNARTLWALMAHEEDYRLAT